MRLIETGTKFKPRALDGMPLMKVTLKLRGGYVGHMDEGKSVDTAQLAADEVNTLARLVAAAKAETELKAERAPDRTERMGDAVKIEEGGQTIVLKRSADEASKFPAFAALRDWLDDHARTDPPNRDSGE